jgi:hypothetical protein
MSATLPADIRDYIDRAVREGFDDEDSIVSNAEDLAESDHGRSNLRRPIKRFTAERLAAHRDEQAQWKGPTDCDRLDAAFAAMQRRGVVARQNFSCCSNCGHGEMWGEMSNMGPNARVEGYAFYHMQDTESAVEGGTLYVKYGSNREGDEAITEVGRVVAEELRKAGLKVQWNGDPGQAVGVVRLDWKRRR